MAIFHSYVKLPAGMMMMMMMMMMMLMMMMLMMMMMMMMMMMIWRFPKIDGLYWKIRLK